MIFITRHSIEEKTRIYKNKKTEIFLLNISAGILPKKVLKMKSYKIAVSYDMSDYISTHRECVDILHTDFLMLP